MLGSAFSLRLSVFGRALVAATKITEVENMAFRKMWLNINGANRMFMCDPVKDSLADVLRRLGLTSVKVGCGIGVCGSCTVMLNGELVRSCTKKMGKLEEYSKVITVEGISPVGRR